MDSLLITGGSGFLGGAFRVIADLKPKTIIHTAALANMEKSRYIHPMGQSGHLLSPQYDNLLVRWQKGDYLAMQTKDYPRAESLVLEVID